MAMRTKIMDNPIMSVSDENTLHLMPARCHRCNHFTDLDSYETRRESTNDHLLIWNLRGQTIGSCGNHAFTAAPGDLIVLPRGLSQFYRPEPGRRWAWMWVHTAGPLADELVRQVWSTQAGPVVRLGLSNTIRQHFEAMLLTGPRNAASTVDHHQQLAADACLTALLAVMRRELDRPGPARQPHWDIEAVIDHIAAHLHEPIQAEDLARVAGLSLPHFNRLFRQRFDTSPMRYVTDRRCERAMTLLGETSLPVQRIAELLGYDDAFYFSRVFKQVTGLAPRHFREAAHSPHEP